MSYGFIQSSGNDSNNTRTTAITVTSGNTLIYSVQLNANSGTITIDDGGQGNTWVPIGSIDDGFGTSLYVWYALNAVAGSTGVLSTCPGQNTLRPMLQEYSGLASYIGVNSAFDNGPGAGANTINSGNINVTPQPAMLWSRCFDDTNTESPSAGTSPISFTSRSVPTVGVEPDFTSHEDARITATGNAAATFGNVHNNYYLIIAAAFAESAGEVDGTAAITEGADTAVGVGTDAVTGSGAVTENSDTAAGIGTVAVTSGTDNINENSDTVAGIGTGVASESDGIGTIIENSDVCSGVGTGPPSTGGGAQRKGSVWEPSVKLAIAAAQQARALKEAERQQQQLFAERKVKLKQLSRKKVEPYKVARRLDDIAAALARIGVQKALAVAEKERIAKEIEQERLESERLAEEKRVADEVARIEAEKVWTAGQAHMAQMREESEAAEAMFVLMTMLE